MPSTSLLPTHTEAALQKATIQTFITKKLLTVGHNLMRQRVKEFLVKYANRSSFTAKVLSGYYPISDSFVRKFDKWLVWKGAVSLSNNDSISCSNTIIWMYQKWWDWKELSKSKSLPWSTELIETHKDRWDWDVLSWNRYLPWSMELIEKYKDRWNWDGLSFNQSVPWSIELIEKYKSTLNWQKLSKNQYLY